nr:hypothetical protein [Bradyrhizobium jicamae]
MGEDFRKQRASLVRDLAARADPFIKRRLLDLAERYEGAEHRPTPVTPNDLQIASIDSEVAEQ